MAHRPLPLVRPRLALARPLDERWRDALDRVARARRFPTSTDTARLAELVTRLSESYNAVGSAPAGLLPARLAFSFPRDVPKAAAAVAELIGAGLLKLAPERSLEVLDLGAGLGASTWGVVRALSAAGMTGSVRSLLVDTDAEALAIARELAAAAPADGVTLRVETSARGAFGALPAQRFDLVILGQMLSEHAPEKTDEERAELHAALLRTLAERHLAADGAIVVIEPALRARARHLHRVRDRVVSTLAPFAPCLHAARCPMLLRERDWCHEDLPIDLPPWLVPIARAAGLRFEGLTFSYLVLRRDGRSLADGERGALRLVATPRVTKGKRELTLCGGPELAHATLLDRDVTPATEPLVQSARGDVLVIEPRAEGRLDRATIARVVGATR